MKSWFPNNNIIFLPTFHSRDKFYDYYANHIKDNPGDGFLIWGYNAPEYIIDFLNQNKINYFYVEDGFLRSKDLGAMRTEPASLVFDNKALYFDSYRESTLENILQNYDFDIKLINRANKLRHKIISKGVSKYNQGVDNISIKSIYGKKTRKRVLVLGQVPDDASIRYGCSAEISLEDLLDIAINENPRAQIIYKPHPDVLAGLRKSKKIEMHKNVLVIEENLSLSDCFYDVDHVYTITSLGGFEALMRGIKVTTLGCPFYSGWGLTDDRQSNIRRRRKLSIDALFAGAYILYPRYHHPYTKKESTPEKIVDFISSC